MPKEKDLHRHLDAEMRHGLSKACKETTDALFQEASAQLAEVLVTTQQATENIMDIVERCTDGQAHAVGMLNTLRERLCVPDTPGASDVSNALDILDCIAVWNHGLGADLSNIMTTLSFQDIAGQRVKKVMEALANIEEVIAGETVLQTKTSWTKTARTSELKGPTKDVHQAQIDNLLTQLGKN